MRPAGTECHSEPVLTADEVDSFIADGFVAIRGAVPGDVIDACQKAIWDELGRHGVTDDPATCDHASHPAITSAGDPTLIAQCSTSPVSDTACGV